LRVAARYAMRATARAASSLHGIFSADPLEPTNCFGAGTQVLNDSNGRPTTETVGDAFASLYVESVNLFRETIDGAVQAQLDAADAQRGSTPTTSSAVQRSVSRADLSRAEAAHRLLAGADGLAGLTRGD